MYSLLSLVAVDDKSFRHSYNVSAAISKDPTHPFRMCIDNLSGRPAQTNITVLRRAYFSPSLPVTMVLLEPISGRRHPLQLHTQSLDHPIVITLHMYYMCFRTHRPPSAVQASTGRAVFLI
ncbi:hypothetical protein BC937DRAFT_92586 [Endogone sp. FLAS-F59071]|nr:hypothetical protein BC937DRAFT_92586 [Endogone sp. FLAS-F59071]|eukprot:RUS15327.1 hypothetical protein BC937DRAFT_92586 [Endogone sp. FLAS-F59071]